MAKTKYNKKAKFRKKKKKKTGIKIQNIPRRETGDTRGNTRNSRGTSLKHQHQQWTDKAYMGNQGLSTQIHWWGNEEHMGREEGGGQVRQWGEDTEEKAWRKQYWQTEGDKHATREKQRKCRGDTKRTQVGMENIMTCALSNTVYHYSF